MQTTARGVRKELKQIISVYQWVIEFSIEKLGMEIIIKQAKADPDDLLDSINNHLIEVCWNYLETHSIGLDKYQLATIIMDLYTKTISELDEPFRVTIKESKHLIQDYLEKNKAKKETLERIKKENENLDKEVAIRKKEQQEKKVNLRPEPEMPSENLEVGYTGTQAPSPKPKKTRARWTDALAIDHFVLPWL